MPLNVTLREYDYESGEYSGILSLFDFGHITRGTQSRVIIFDIVVTGTSSVSSVTLSLTSAGSLSVPKKGVDDNDLATAGLFGVETHSTIVRRDSLSQYFTGIGSEISVPMSGNNVSNFVYLSVNPGNYIGVSNPPSYRVDVECLDTVVVSSSSSSSSLSSSSSHS